ncbi:Ldo16p SCDLUD_002681 [Saccharomycodes ludwigii]|nr:hypothetical protein SCDLUD_002681 [Saccharomycodes ludwigii]KAH3901195.1 hypothetical protein SCDLUD_002681 [Saccharomycodes ludwigii]
MLIVSALYFTIYFILFVIVASIAALFVGPLMIISSFFAMNVVLFGFLSNLFYQGAQFIYERFVFILQNLLKRMAEQIPPNGAHKLSSSSPAVTHSKANIQTYTDNFNRKFTTLFKFFKKDATLNDEAVNEQYYPTQQPQPSTVNIVDAEVTPDVVNDVTIIH